MRVLVDATPIPRDRGGVGRYVDSIVPALVATGAEVHVVAKSDDVEGFRRAGAQVTTAPSWVRRTPGRLLWEQFELPRVASRLGASVIHSVHYSFPLLTRAPRVTGVHDLTFFSDPELHGRIKGPYFRAWIRASALLRIDVVAPSRATASEWLARAGRGASERRVHVAHHGYDSSRFAPPTPERVDALRSEFGVESWLAFLGTLEPRKNVPALIAAYRRSMADRSPGDRPALLLAGAPGWDDAVGPSVADAVDAGFDVRTLGYLPLDMLSAFLGGAELVVYPSLGEGFGLPVLEAMASGALVSTTRRLSLPEVGGEAVLYSEPDVASIAEVLTEALDLPADAARDLRSRAIERAALFTWAAAAEAHLAAYRSAVERRS